MNKRTSRLGALSILFVASCGAAGDVSQSGVPASVTSCGLAGCSNGAGYQGKFSLGGVAPTDLEVRSCFNQRCETRKIQPGPTGQRAFDCSVGASLNCLLDTEQTTGLANIYIQGENRSGGDPTVTLQEGDIYDVTVGEPGQPPLLRLGAVAGYRTVFPNGAGCEPTCKRVTLAPTF